MTRIPAVLLLLVILAGCHKPSGDTKTAGTSEITDPAATPFRGWDPTGRWGEPTPAERTAIRTIQGNGGTVERGEKYLVMFPRTSVDADLATLRDLPRVTHVMARCPALTDAGVVHLLGLANLKRLNLSYTQLTDAGLEQLTALAGLEQLSIAGTKVTDAGVEKYQAARPGVKVGRREEPK